MLAARDRIELRMSVEHWVEMALPVTLSYDRSLPSCNEVAWATVWNEGVRGTVDPTPSPVNMATGILGHDGYNLVFHKD